MIDGKPVIEARRDDAAVTASLAAAAAWEPTLHAFAVFGATLPGLAAVTLGVLGVWRLRARARSLRVLAWLGALTFVAGFADAAGYAFALATRAGCLPWLPALQKLVALSLVAWMLSVAAEAWRSAENPR